MERIQVNTVKQSNNPWRNFATDPPPKEEAILLVWLEEPLLHSRLQISAWHSNVPSVGCLFIFDAPKILKWKYADEFYPEGDV
jgi:hypothetical protein